MKRNSLSSSVAVWLALIVLGLTRAQAGVVDDFNAATRSGWTDFTFIPGFGLPTQSNGQLRFEQPVSPSGGGIFSATQKTSEAFELKDGRSLEFRVDVVEGGAKDSFAVLAFIPTAGSGGPGSLAGYGLAKSTTDVLITKGINKYFVADDGVTAELKQDNITLSLRLTAEEGRVVVRAQVLDKAANNAVIWDRTVVDTPAADVMADGEDSPAAPFITSGYFTLYIYQDLDRNAPKDPYRVVYDNARVIVSDRVVLDDFNDNQKTGWTDFTFIPGFGLPAESNGQFRFEQPVSPSGGGIFSASQKTSRTYELKDGEELEFRADVIEGGAKDSFAVLAFIPTAGSGGPGSLAGYGLAKSTTDVLITKGINKYFVADDGVTAELKQDNITLSLRLLPLGGSVELVAQVLDKANGNAALWERRVLDTPAADVMADGEDSPAPPFITSGYFTLYLYQDLDRNAPEDPYRVVYDNAVVGSAPSTANQGPVLADLLPADTGNFLPAPVRLSFRATDDQPLPDTGLAVTVNGIRYTSANGLTLGGTASARDVSLQLPGANSNYVAVIEITDAGNLTTRRTIHFDTFLAGNPTIESENYNFGGGQFINSPALVPEGSGPDATTYSNQEGVAGVDFSDTRATPDAQNTPWRSADPVRMARSLDNTRAAYTAAGGSEAQIYDYVVGDIAANEWLQYSRALPAGTYEVYLRQSLANVPTAESVLELVTGDPTQPDPATRPLGTFLATQTGFIFRNTPLTDGTGTTKAVLRVTGGTTTLRLRQVTPDPDDGARYQNYLVLVPVQDAGPQRATIASTVPAAGSTTATVAPTVSATIQNRDTSVDVATLKLTVNGVEVSSPTVTPNASGAVISTSLSPLPPSGATNTARVAFRDNQGQEISTEWSFVITYLSLDPATAVSGTGRDRGFNLHVVQAPAENGALENSLDRAEQQIAANSSIPRLVDTNAVLNLINLSKREGEDRGHFPSDLRVPGIDPDTTGNGEDDFAVEILTYLELPAGVHRLGVNSDDGFKLSSGRAPLGAGSPVLLFHNGGPGDDRVDFVVSRAGLYAVRLLWYERSGAGHAEFFSENLTGGQGTERILINDPAVATAIKAWRTIDAVVETLVVESAPAVTGPFVAESSAVIDATARRATVARAGEQRFYRLRSTSAQTLSSIRVEPTSVTLAW